MKTSAIASLVCFLPVAAAIADEVKPPPPPPPLWSGKAELSFVSTSGNTDTQTLGAGAEVEYQPGIWSGKVRLDYLRSEANGEENAHFFAALLRGARKIAPRLEVYALGGYLKNRFAGIDRRLAGEAGLAYDLLPPNTHSLKAEGGLGYTKENRVSGLDRSFASARAGLLYKWKFSKTADFSNEVSYTQDLNASKDWRFADAASVSAALVSRLSLKVSYAIAKLNDPPPGFKKTDTITSAAIVAKF
jgi:putative salt-induced outer membrane protein